MWDTHIYSKRKRMWAKWIALSVKVVYCMTEFFANNFGWCAGKNNPGFVQHQQLMAFRYSNICYFSLTIWSIFSYSRFKIQKLYQPLSWKWVSVMGEKVNTFCLLQIKNNIKSAYCLLCRWGASEMWWPRPSYADIAQRWVLLWGIRRAMLHCPAERNTHQ